MPGVIRRAIGLMVVALTAGVAASALADVPPGPRLAFVQFSYGPGALTIATSDPALREQATVAGGGARVRPLPYPFSGPTWSPVGSLIAFSGMKGPAVEIQLPKNRQIYLAEADGGGLRAIPGTRGGFGPVFSPDGKSIAFAKTARRRLKGHGPFGRTVWKGTTVWSVGIDGGGLKQLTEWANGVEDLPSSFSPDGSVLGLTHRDVFHDRADAVALRLGGSGSYVLARNAGWPRYSPDGSRIAFLGIRRIGDTSCCELGDGFSVDLYTMNADRSSRLRLTDTPAKAERPASWDPSGERLAYTTKSAPTEDASGELEAAVMQINADGTCLARISASIPRIGESGISFRYPTWQPGSGRGTGRIAC
jgi:TolB protein